jgi:hypothetical protein
MAIPGKGHNKILEIAHPLVQMRVAINAVQLHPSENRDTCAESRDQLESSLNKAK